KLASETGDQYSKSTEIPDYIVEHTPDQVQLMYWQYNSIDIEHYRNIFKQHRAFNKKPSFAGDVWVWKTFATNDIITLQARGAALAEGKEANLEDVVVKLEEDDGYENKVFNALLGLHFDAEHAYA